MLIFYRFFEIGENIYANITKCVHIDNRSLKVIRWLLGPITRDQKVFRQHCLVNCYDHEVKHFLNFFSFFHLALVFPGRRKENDLQSTYCTTVIWPLAEK